MKRMILLLGALAIVSAFAVRAGPAATPGQRQALRFEPAVIVDATGFDRPVGAATLFIPHGWQTQGGVEWGQQYMCTNGYAINWQTSSPDGSRSYAILPQERWESNNFGAPPTAPGCGFAPFADVRQYLENAVQRWRPGSRALDYRRRADIERELVQLNTRTPMPAGELRQWVEVGELLFAFGERGHEMRGTATVAVLFNLSRADYGMGPMDSLVGHAFGIYAATAPNGQLDIALADALRRSLKLNPEWERRIAGHNTAIGRAALEESRKRSEILTRTNEEIARIRQESWDNYQQSADRRAREFAEVIRGVETYADADAPGGSVELSHMYEQAWRLNDGSYVLTNDPSFDPWRELQIEGRRLEAAP